MAFGEYAGQPTEGVKAEQLEDDRSIITPRGVVEGHKGDWEVRYADGNVMKMTDEEWQAGQGKGETTSPQESPGEGEDTREKNNGDDDSEDSPETPEKSPRDRSEKTSRADDELF